ncbi:endonuclease domain-containing protein [Streptomyces sp. SP18CS02]|uniref:endonuclease domain-containing protein n=1 Tax=Streptomyces sp. SP18CS02 TaxID=3002531 RepID=UPI003FCCA77A
MRVRLRRWCAIRREADGAGRALSIDHDHACCPDRAESCGRCARALLCTRRHHGLGRFRDCPALLRAAAAHGEGYRAPQAVGRRPTVRFGLRLHTGRSGIPRHGLPSLQEFRHDVYVQ